LASPATTPVTRLGAKNFGRGAECRHCYAGSSPEGDHGTMTADNWERVIDDAQALSMDTVQFIGGEPTLHPELPRLVRYALGTGLKVDVYTNLVHVTPELWELFFLPGVSLGTSWYSADPDQRADITGSKGSHARTRGNIAEALRRGIPIRAGIVEVLDGQDTATTRAELLALGDILGGTRWREIISSIPAQATCTPTTCTPTDSNDCDPARQASGLGTAR
jgi:sulfatase maturation enzyme AslB (radical SAM superfamily)